MQNKIIQSIHHEHAENILIGAKGYEMRKSAPKDSNFPYIIYLYETKHPYRDADGTLRPGVGAVVGFYVCKSIIKTNAFGAALYKSNTPEGAAIRKEIAKKACLTEEQLIEYADGNDVYAYVVSTPIRFPKPRPLSDFGLTRAPQSWQFIK